MSTAAEIETAIRRLPANEAHAVAKWLQNYLVYELDPPSFPFETAAGKWRGKGQLPKGGTVDEYLRLTRDGHGG
jgi:hypothetical protein